MTQPYNLTGIANSETFGGLMAAVSTDLTGGFLLLGLIMAVFVILLLILVGRDVPFEKATLVSAYICTVPTLIFVSAGMLRILPAFMMIALMFLAALISWIVDRYF